NISTEMQQAVIKQEEPVSVQRSVTKPEESLPKAIKVNGKCSQKIKPYSCRYPNCFYTSKSRDKVVDHFYQMHLIAVEQKLLRYFEAAKFVKADQQLLMLAEMQKVNPATAYSFEFTQN